VTRVGLLGGAFNPPHQGHLALARLALAHLALDELRFVPTAVSPHKPDPGGPDGPTRLRLLAMALQALGPAVRIDRSELDRGGASYTVDTLEALHAAEPESQWVWVMGSDQLAGLPTWRRASRVLELAAVAVGTRPGVPFQTPAMPGLKAVDRWSGAAGELIQLPCTDLDLASTHLRTTLHELPDASPDGLPPQVLSIIRSENLYR
jgi:nicotinate-nucleotide adenylyltransferase